MTKRSGIFALMAALAVVLLSISLFAAPSGAVGSNTPTVTISGNPNPGSTTGSVTYTVTVTGSAGAATGSVDVSDWRNWHLLDPRHHHGDELSHFGARCRADRLHRHCHLQR